MRAGVVEQFCLSIMPAMLKVIPALDARSRPLQDLRISLIDRCNFRCPYCMPAEKFGGAGAFLPKHQWLNPEQIEKLVHAFILAGIRKVRLTGGEPLLRKDLIEIVERLGRIEGIDDLALTTNGVLLAERAAALRCAGLHRLTISLDALDPSIFKTMSGGYGDVREVLAGIHAAQLTGFPKIKINTVIRKGVNENQIMPLVEYFRGSSNILRFIEYMDVGSCNGWRRDQVFSVDEIRQVIATRYELIPVPANSLGEVATRFRYADGKGEIGLIGSISRPFCGDCNRVRISVEGKLYTCLFANTGIDLRAWLDRTDAVSELSKRIRNLWSNRSDRYSELRAEKEEVQSSRVEMFRLGG